MVAKNHHCLVLPHHDQMIANVVQKKHNPTLEFSRMKLQNETCYSASTPELTTKKVVDKKKSSCSMFIEDFDPFIEEESSSSSSSTTSMAQSLIYFSFQSGITDPGYFVSKSFNNNNVVNYIGDGDDEKDNTTDSTGSICSWETYSSTQKSRLSTIYSCDDDEEEETDDDDNEIYGRTHYKRCAPNTATGSNNNNIHHGGDWDNNDEDDDAMSDISDVFADLPHDVESSSDVFDNLSCLLDYVVSFRKNDNNVAHSNNHRVSSGSSNNHQHTRLVVSQKEQMDHEKNNHNNKKRQNTIFFRDEYTPPLKKKLEGKWHSSDKKTSEEKNPLDMAISSILSLFTCA